MGDVGKVQSMKRLPYEVCKPYYEALGINFERDNPAQFEVIKGKDRFPLIIGGERGGKSFASAAMLVPHIDLLPKLRRERFYHEDGTLKYNWKSRSRIPLVPDFVIFGPSYAEPRIEFSYVEDWLRQLDNVAYVSKPQEGPWRLITKDGVVLSTWSTDNPGTIRGIDLEGCLAAECGNMEYEAVERIQGRIGAKVGFCIYSGTMENAKRWYIQWALEGERQNRWGVRTYSLPSWGNISQFPGGRNDPEIKRWEAFYTDDVFQTRVAARPMPPRDRVLRELNETHIRKVSIPRDDQGHLAATIEICIDPGYLPSAYSVLWVASWPTSTGKFWYIFDELYEQQIGNDTVIEWIKHHRFYKYLQIDGLTIDVSAKRHSDGHEPAVDVFKRLTKLKSPYHQYWHENALMDRIRTTAKQDLIAIHPNCRGLIAEAGLGEAVFPDMHPWRYETARDGIILHEKPKDAWNHSAKALGYLLLRHLGLVERLGQRPSSKNRMGKTVLTRPRKTIFKKRLG